MKKKTRWLGLYVPAFIILALSAVVLRTAAYLGYYDPSTEGFSDRTILTVGQALLAVGIIFSLSYLFIRELKEGLVPSFGTPSVFIPSSIVAIALVYYAIVLIASSGPEFIEAISDKSMPLMGKVTAAFPFLAGIFALPGVGMFVMNTLSEKRESVPRAAFGMLLVLSFLFYIFYLCTERSRLTVSEARMADTMSYVAFSLFMLFEIRLSIGRDAWRLYAVFGMIAAGVGAYCSIPALIVIFARGETITLTVYDSVLTFAMTVYAGARLLTTVTLSEDRESPVVALIKRRSAHNEDRETQAERNGEEI